MREIERGTLDIAMRIRRGEEKVGFDLSGPFDMSGELPVTDMTYAQISGPRHFVTRLISTGSGAFIEVSGTAYALPEDKLAPLRREPNSGIQELRIDRWMANPSLKPGPTIDGVRTHLVEARLQPGRAIIDLMSVAQGLGGSAAPELTGKTSQEIDRLARAATLQIWTGRQDLILRRIVLAVTLAAPEGEQSSDVTRAFEPIQFEMSLDLLAPNRSIKTIRPPVGARPYSELPQGA